MLRFLGPDMVLPSHGSAIRPFHFPFSARDDTPRMFQRYIPFYIVVYFFLESPKGLGARYASGCLMEVK